MQYGTSALIKFAVRQVWSPDNGFDFIGLLCVLTSGRAIQAAVVERFRVSFWCMHCETVGVELSELGIVSTIAIMFSDMLTRSMYDTKHARNSCVAIRARTGISPENNIVLISRLCVRDYLPFGKILNCIVAAFLAKKSRTRCRKVFVYICNKTTLLELLNYAALSLRSNSAWCLQLFLGIFSSWKNNFSRYRNVNQKSQKRLVLFHYCWLISTYIFSRILLSGFWSLFNDSSCF